MVGWSSTTPTRSARREARTTPRDDASLVTTTTMPSSSSREGRRGRRERGGGVCRSGESAGAPLPFSGVCVRVFRYPQRAYRERIILKLGEPTRRLVGFSTLPFGDEGEAAKVTASSRGRAAANIPRARQRPSHPAHDRGDHPRTLSARTPKATPHLPRSRPVAAAASRAGAARVSWSGVGSRPVASGNIPLARVIRPIRPLHSPDPRTLPSSDVGGRAGP